MARNPYGKRIAQGAAQGALGAGAAGFALGGPVGGLVGLGVGGLAGSLMARPGDDEKRLRARMRRLEMGVLGDEEAAIRARFMNPVRGAAQEQEVRRRALEQGTGASGAAARRGQAAQRAARGDIAEAGQEATLAAMDLSEQRRQQAQRINQGLLAQEGQRDSAFRQNMFNQGLMAAGQIGSTLGDQRALKVQEAALLPGAARGVRNAADLASMSDEQLLDDHVANRPREEAPQFLPDVLAFDEPTAPVSLDAETALQADALEAAYAGDSMLFGSAGDPAPDAPAAPAPMAPAASAYNAAETSQALATLGIGSASMEFPGTSFAAPTPVDEFLAGLSQEQRDEIPVYYSKMPALQSLDFQSQERAIESLNRMSPGQRGMLDWDSYNTQLVLTASLE